MPTGPEGFTEFVLGRGASLHRTAVLLAGDQHAAEDLVQNALAKAWRSWHRISGEPEAYVRRILVNDFASGRRRRWRGERPTEVLPEPSARERPAGGHAHGDHSETVATRQSLIEALTALPPRQRAVVVLRYFHDYSEARTAEALGVTAGTVKSQTVKALTALRISDHLSHEGSAVR